MLGTAFNPLRPAQTNLGRLPVPHPRQVFSGLVEWWSAGDLPSMKQHTDGTVAVAADGDTVAYWRGQIASTVITTSGNGAADPYKVNRLGRRAAIAFSGGSNGFIGALAHTFTTALTFIVIGRFTGVSLTFRPVFCAGPDTSTDPGSVTNGFDFATWDDGARLGVIRNNSVATYNPVVVNTPYVITGTFNHRVTAPVNIPGISQGTTYAGIQKLWLNGGRPQQPETEYARYYSDQTPIAIADVGVGCRTDSRSGAAFDMCDVFLIDGEPTGRQMQKFQEQWILPVYGPGVF